MKKSIAFFLEAILLIAILVFFVYAIIEKNYGLAVFNFIVLMYSLETFILRARVRTLEAKTKRANDLIMRMTNEEVEEISRRELKD